MEPAIRSIVDTYVRLGDRRRLDSARAHRDRLIASLRDLRVTDVASKLIVQLEDDIAVIDAGLAKLRPAVAA
jgi:hypothetical protein